MPSVYQLLRNNQQSGPYTIDEIKQQHLLPTDLVWVDGESSAWRYPHELKEFAELSTGRDHPANAPTHNRSKNPGERKYSRDHKGQIAPTVKRYKDEIERKAEELRRRAMSYKPEYYTARKEVEESYHAAHILEDENFQFIDHRQKNNTRVSEWVGGLFVTALVFGGLYFGNSLIRTQQAAQPAEATQVITSTTTHAARSLPANKPLTLELSTVDSTQILVQAAEKRPTMKTPVVKKIKKDSASKIVTSIEPQVITSTNEEKESLSSSDIAIPELKPKEIIKPEVPVISKEEDNKKKTLGESLKGIFKKKKKNEADTAKKG